MRRGAEKRGGQEDRAVRRGAEKRGGEEAAGRGRRGRTATAPETFRCPEATLASVRSGEHPGPENPHLWR